MLRDRAKGKRPVEVTQVTQPVPQLITQIQQTSDQHVNFFSDLEAGKYISTKVNEAHVKEKKEEQEKYEKQVGYLTYLGQDTNEATGKRDWYDLIPNRADKLDESGKVIEVNLKSKHLQDPMTLIDRYVGKSYKNFPTPKKEETETKVVKKYEPIIDRTFKEHRKRRRSLSTSSGEKSPKKRSKSKKKKHKKSRHQSPSSSSLSSDDDEKRILQKKKLEKLRAERLQREKVERAKADKLLAKLRGDPDPEEKKKVEVVKHQPRPVKQKYNSQFNPEIARQNYD